MNEKEKQSGDKCQKCGKELVWMGPLVGTEHSLVVKSFCCNCGIGYAKEYQEIEIKNKG